MIGLLLVAAVSGATAPPAITQPMPNLFRQPAWCPSVVQHEVARQNTAFHGHVPAVQYAVMRQIDGCGVPTPIGYHPGYLLPGAADPASRPEDGPENRR